MKKISVGVVFGGRSAEHEVSIVSAQSVMDALDKSKFEIVPIGITRTGEWITGDDVVSQLKEGKEKRDTRSIPICFSHSEEKASVFVGGKGVERHVDVFFPVLHGTYGEDGTVQGVFEMLGVPYVGCDVLASALGMNKIMAKTVWTVHGLPLAKYLPVTRLEWTNDPKRVERQIIDGIGLPCFIKPSTLGSSIGISKVKGERDLKKALDLAFEYDNTIVAEEAIDAREIECAVLGNEKPRASLPAEILPSDEFYSFEDKYLKGTARTVVPADLPGTVVKEIQNTALKAFTTLGCSGMARVDFLIDRTRNKVYLNELNTIPGFTSISMYPKMWEVSGLPYPKLLEQLIELAMERHANQERVRTSFQSNSNWYKK